MISACTAVIAAMGLSAGVTSQSQATTKTLGLIIFNGQDTFSQLAEKGILAAAKTNGWTVKTVDVAGSVDGANSAIQNFVSAKVNAIIATVVASTSLKSGLAQAKKAGIPVVSQSGGLAPGIAGNVTSVNDVSNAAPLLDMAKVMGGKGRVLAFTFKPGLPCLLRENTLDSVMSKYPNITVTKSELPSDGHAAYAASTTAAWLQTNASYSGNLAVWACYDDPAVAAISSITASGKKAFVYGYNGSADALAAIKAGTMKGTVFFDPIATGKATFAAVLTSLKAGKKANLGTIAAPFTLITSANVATLLP
jgi:ribose transport system substrate-binding protein